MAGTIVGFTSQYITDWKQSQSLANVRGTIIEPLGNGDVLVVWHDGFCARAERIVDLVFYS